MAQDKRKRNDRADAEMDEQIRPEDERQERRPVPRDPEEPYTRPVVTQEENPDELDHVDEAGVNYVLVDSDPGDQDFPIEDEDLDDAIVVGTYKERVVDEIDDYTSDQEIVEDFAERQETGAGSDQLMHRLREYKGRTPEAAANDIDAYWEGVDQSGEESAGGSTPTPDQDQVGEIGEALGINYQDGEPLDTEDKLLARDYNRWELNPASAEDRQEQLEDLGEGEDYGEDYLELEEKMEEAGIPVMEDDLPEDRLEEDRQTEEEFRKAGRDQQEGEKE